MNLLLQRVHGNHVLLILELLWLKLVCTAPLSLLFWSVVAIEAIDIHIVHHYSRPRSRLLMIRIPLHLAHGSLEHSLSGVSTTPGLLLVEHAKLHVVWHLNIIKDVVVQVNLLIWRLQHLQCCLLLSFISSSDICLL
jgi:hypothetical protein